MLEEIVLVTLSLCTEWGWRSVEAYHTGQCCTDGRMAGGGRSVLFQSLSGDKELKVKGKQSRGNRLGGKRPITVLL